ncbi:hypothetical protein DFJ77DRAFT_168492 [Powellomyces hirtus]|nr:hypothetical protein DFJ77DRAFT_168492 [Powellomyces hirtus]
MYCPSKYSCTNTFLTSAQFATREANTLCTACPPENVACTSSCCTEITTGSACVCPADLRGPTCNARIPFTCTPRLLAPTLSGCTNSGTRGGAASYEPGSDVDDANDTNACPRFGTTEAIEFRFEVACRQVQQLKVYLTPQSGGFTDGLFLYFLGDRDLFAYSNQPYVPQQFRLKFFNFFHPSDNSQAYFTPLDPPALALTGNKTFSITVNMSNVLAGGYQGAGNEYAAGGRVYFEGGIHNPGFAPLYNLAGNSSFRNYINFQPPQPRSSNARLSDTSGPPLSTGAIAGIAIAGAVVFASVVNYWIKEKRRLARA